MTRELLKSIVYVSGIQTFVLLWFCFAKLTIVYLLFFQVHVLLTKQQQQQQASLYTLLKVCKNFIQGFVSSFLCVCQGRCVLNTAVFAPDQEHAEIVDLCKGYWNPQRKMGVATHFFEIISLDSRQNADISVS